MMHVYCAQTLSYVQMELDAWTNQLASQCIAFEEKLGRENIDTLAADSEAEKPTEETESSGEHLCVITN